jgi:6-phosphogluconolactonase
VLPNQDGPHMHCATVSPANDFVLACNLGNDAIEVFPIHPGAENPLGPAMHVATRVGSGPRHVAFHPNGRWVYVIHELDCTVELFDWRVKDGVASLTRAEGTAVSTLGPAGKSAGDSGCEILVGASGKFAYTCTRGVNSLQVFSVDKIGGLTLKQQLKCGGLVPRHIAFDPTERWLLCANQGGPGVTVFEHDAKAGLLKGPVQMVEADTPMFVLFV